MITATFTLTCDRCSDVLGYSDTCDAGENVHPVIPVPWKRDGAISVAGKTTVRLLCPKCAAEEQQEARHD